jgi:RimJ/RimL family protein N-acetyltransferase
MWEGVLLSHTIFDDRARRVGNVVAYRADFKNGTVYMAMIIEPCSNRAFIANDTVLLFVNYLLTCWPIRKIYGEVSERNLAQFKGALGRTILEEGRLKEHDYYNGKYWDFLVVALYRATWLEQIHTQLPRLLPSGVPGD